MRGFFSLVSLISPPEGCIDDIDTRWFTNNARFSTGLGMLGNATEINSLLRMQDALQIFRKRMDYFINVKSQLVQGSRADRKLLSVSPEQFIP